MKVLSLFGTRPEAIKMAPIIMALRSDSYFKSIVCVTAQHRQMLDQVLNLFEIRPDYDLNIMKDAQDLYDITSKVLIGVRDILEQEHPDMILVQGDTTTCFAGALAGFYAQIPVAHIEAGLRTGDLMAPFPEEANRVMTSRLVNVHFAPTEQSRQNLLDEMVRPETIHVTGNSVIDALLWVRKRVTDQHEWGNAFSSATETIRGNHRFVLITGHRRENFGCGFRNICDAISVLATRHPEIHFIYPVHLNPNVLEPVYSILANHNNIHLIAPLEYAPFVYAMDRCAFILTDSGGIQEEAPSLGKSVLVMRETTERLEALSAGIITLVGTDARRIIHHAERLILNTKIDCTEDIITNPYGDGNAAERIRLALHLHYRGANNM